MEWTRCTYTQPDAGTQPPASFRNRQRFVFDLRDDCCDCCDCCWPATEDRTQRIIGGHCQRHEQTHTSRPQSERNKWAKSQTRIKNKTKNRFFSPLVQKMEKERTNGEKKLMKCLPFGSWFPAWDVKYFLVLFSIFHFRLFIFYLRSAAANAPAAKLHNVLFLSENSEPKEMCLSIRPSVETVRLCVWHRARSTTFIST